MSRATELAEAEAARVEAEDSAEAAAEPVEPAEVAPDVPPDDASEVTGPVDTKALERALGRHEREMEKVLGEGFADMKPCDTCQGFGFVPQDLTPEPEVMFDENTEPCPKCNGYGQVLTGARAPADPTRPCTNCAGGGYVTRQVQMSAPQAGFPPVGQVPANGGDAVAAPVIDPQVVEMLRRAGFTVIEPYGSGALGG